MTYGNSNHIRLEVSLLAHQNIFDHININGSRRRLYYSFELASEN